MPAEIVLQAQSVSKGIGEEWVRVDHLRKDRLVDPRQKQNRCIIGVDLEPSEQLNRLPVRVRRKGVLPDLPEEHSDGIGGRTLLVQRPR